MHVEPTYQRLLIVDVDAREVRDASPTDLVATFDPGDLLVVNDAATFPASIRARSEGRELELRFLELPRDRTARAVLFGDGDHRMRTEDRPAPPALRRGAELAIGDVRATVVDLASFSPRLVSLAFDASDEAVLATLYRDGAPIQYSYVPEPLRLFDVQTAVAGRPWAAEMPSAARPIRHGILAALRARGVEVAAITHAAGISASGDPALDAALPLPERYDIPAWTVDRIARTRREGGRVVAVGTTVVRALEDSAARHGTPVAGEAIAELVLDASTKPAVVDSLLTGIHVEGESHHRLLRAFVDDALLAHADAHAERGGYRLHETGDACLILRHRRSVMTRAA